MGTVSEKIEETVKEEGKVVEMTPTPKEETPKALSPDEKVLAAAEVIKEKRASEENAARDEAMLVLKEKYGLGKEELKQCQDVEKDLNDPEKGIKTLIDALDFYKNSELTNNQFAFLAINTNSMNNMLRMQMDRLQADVQAARQEVNALMQAAAVSMGMKKSIEKNPTTEE